VFRSVRQRDRSSGDVGVDMAPLIDVVFILLIFFLVTTTFVHDTGLTVTKPDSVANPANESKSLRIEIDYKGAIRIDGQPVEAPALRGRVLAFLGEHREGAIIVIPDRAAPAGRLVEAVNTAESAGATSVAIAGKGDR